MKQKTNKIVVLGALAMLTAVAAPASAADYTIKAGSADVTVYFNDTLNYAVNPADGGAAYVRPRQAEQPISLSELGSMTAGHAEGGFYQGEYVTRLDLPDAAVAAGAPYVDVVMKDDDGDQRGRIRIDLVGYDPSDSTRLGLTALPNAAAEAGGGIITRGTAAGQLNVNEGRADADVLRLNGDSQSLLDLKDLSDNGYEPSSNTIQAVDATGYKNVLHVGSGHTYATITAAEAAAVAGDLILVHPGTYSDILIGKDGLTYVLAYGVTLDGEDETEEEPTFDGSAGSFRVLGHGAISSGDTDSRILELSTSAHILIECDVVDARHLHTEAFRSQHASARLTVRAQRIIGPEDAQFVACSDGCISIEANQLEGGDEAVVDVLGAGSIVDFRLTNMRNPAETLVSGSAGTVRIDGLIECTNLDSNGINAPSGVTVIATTGAVKVPAGRPALSGSGKILVSDAFAYDASSAIATNIVKTPTSAIYAKLPSKPHLTGTSNSDGDVQLDEATGEAVANAIKWAGSETSTDDIALKSSLTKGLEIMGFNDPAAAATASAIRTELAAELARIDASISSRHASGAAVASVVGGVGSVNDPATIWNALTSGMTTSDSVGERIANLPTQNYFDTLFDGAPTFANAMDAQGYTVVRAEKLDNLDLPVSEIRLQTPSLLVSTTIDTLTNQTTFTLAAGPPDDDALNGALIVVTDSVNAAQKAIGLVKDYDGATRAVTLVTDPGVFTMSDDDEVDVIATGSPAALWLGGNP